MTDTDYRRYTTAELRAAALAPWVRFEDKLGNIWHRSVYGTGYAIRAASDDGQGEPGTYKPHSELARCKLRRIA